jgi:hypothetical protein
VSGGISIMKIQKIYYCFSIIFLFLFINGYSQQFDKSKFILETNIDKAVLSTVYYVDEENAPVIIKSPMKKDSVTGKLILPEIEQVFDTTYIVKRAILSQEETKNLLSLLKKPELGHALLYHYDIQINFYRKNILVQKASISSTTRNLEILKMGCKPYIDKNGTEIDPCFFRGKISEELKKYIVQLLREKKLWTKDEKFAEDW